MPEPEEQTPETTTDRPPPATEPEEKVDEAAEAEVERLRKVLANDRAPLPEPSNDVPEWVVLPPDFNPPRGRQVIFMLFRAKWTDTPHKGDRQCALWTLSEGEERMAYKNCAGEPTRVGSELSKAMIRVVDGVRVDWGKPKGAGSIDEFWNDIGMKCRQALQRVCNRLNTLSEEEQADFFGGCVSIRSAT